MLENLNKILLHDGEKPYAVGAFNGYNYETFKGIFDAGKEMGQPIILAFGAKYLPNMSLATAAALANSLDNTAALPVCLHLDHCSDMNIVFQAIGNGFSSVMYDGSRLSFEDNVVNTKKICEVAHANGVSVEAELGCISVGRFSHEGEKEDILAYTDPEAAKQFVEATHVDALAISIGTVHGMYTGTPRLRIDILKKIHKLVPIPLVLHGGSGLSQKELFMCIENGIKKVNVNTEISMCVIDQTQKFLNKEHNVHYSVLALKQTACVKDIVKRYIAYLSGGNR